jgi:3-isopropylmalate/(R)-2-methylmalate dehydratase large subunit
MGMTIAEKILAKKGGHKAVVPGDVVTVEVDTVVLFDNNFIPSIWREILQVYDAERIVVALDHRVPAPNAQVAASHRTARDFARRFGVKRFHDVGINQGISHQLVADHGYALPGSVLICSDSHTCSAGVFNGLARGVGGPDMVYATTKGHTWFRCGETVRYELTGRLSAAVTAKDAFLQIAGVHGAHATQNVEYGGPGIANLSINARKTLTTMSAELSAEFATFEPDGVMLDWVGTRNPGRKLEPVYPDKDAKYLAVRKVDLGALEPLVALPDTVVNNSQPVKAVAGTRIDQAYIGSCANGTQDDLELAAQVVKGRRVAPGTRFIVIPGSQTVYRDALKSGAIQTLMDAGAMIGPPTCGACGGGHMGVIGPEEVCITSSTRNFKGRMGDPSSKVYMGSSATVAASAIRGVITDPREFLN